VFAYWQLHWGKSIEQVGNMTYTQMDALIEGEAMLEFRKKSKNIKKVI